MTGFLQRLVHLTRILRSLEKGQTMVEYSLIVAAIAILVFAAYTTTGQSVQSLVSWGAIANDLLGS
jgi:Flp pilus assembly pilin Flp